MIKCHLNISPGKECYEVCVQSRKCEALKIWESEMKQMKLKSCPFCGWGTIVDGGFLNHKCTCNSCGASTKGYPTWGLAMEAWNKRVGEQDDNRTGD